MPHSIIYLRFTCFALRGRFTRTQAMAATGMSGKTISALLLAAQGEGLCRVVGTTKEPGTPGTPSFLYEFINPYDRGEGKS